MPPLLKPPMLSVMANPKKLHRALLCTLTASLLFLSACQSSYRAQGSSGSPILDPTGRVIGVLYGGQTGTNGRIIYGVPVRFVHQLLSGTQ